MTIKEFIPKLNDVYTDQNGLLHIDVNLPVAEGNENFILMEKFGKEKQFKARIRELYDLSDYECVDSRIMLDCYYCSVWKKKGN